MKARKPLRRASKKAIKDRELDALARLVVLARDGNKCVRCGKSEGLQWAHVFSRRFKSVRWEPDNAMTLCAGCHFWWHDRPVDASEWWLGTMPSYRVDRLRAFLKRGEKPNRERVKEYLRSRLGLPD